MKYEFYNWKHSHMNFLIWNTQVWTLQLEAFKYEIKHVLI